MFTEVCNDNYNFHQFSFSQYDSDNNNWHDADGHPCCREELYDGNCDLVDVFTAVINEPFVCNFSWWNEQTVILKGFYEAAIDDIARKFSLEFLRISIEPNGYGSVMLAISVEESAKDKINDIIEYLHNDIFSIMPGEYEGFMCAMATANDLYEEVGNFQGEENGFTEFLDFVEGSYKVAGYDWTEDSVKECQEIWTDVTGEAIAGAVIGAEIVVKKMMKVPVFA